jgi:hypothetical protein
MGNQPGVLTFALALTGSAAALGMLYIIMNGVLA